MKEGQLWARYTWGLMHLVSIKIKDDDFLKEKQNILKIITTICHNLPCPHCRSHAIQFLNKSKEFKVISTKTQLIDFLFNFHNIVNKKIGKKCYDKSILKQYDAISLDKVISIWNKYFKLFYVDQYIFKEEIQRSNAKKAIVNYLKTNSHIFI